MNKPTEPHTLQDILQRLFAQLSEHDQYILIADADTLLHAAKLREKCEKKKGYQIVMGGGKHK